MAHRLGGFRYSAALVSCPPLRGGLGERRHQISWLATRPGLVAVADGGAAVGPSSIPTASLQPRRRLTIVEGIGIGLLMPVALAIAILKYRLYDIDVVISRTLVYGSLAALITGVYVAIAVGLGELVGSGGKPNLGLSILATAIVAVGFQPVRERLQRVANRLVYGKRATPYEVLSEFSSRVAESVRRRGGAGPHGPSALQRGRAPRQRRCGYAVGVELPPCRHPSCRARRLGALPMADGAVPEVPGGGPGGGGPPPG